MSSPRSRRSAGSISDWSGPGCALCFRPKWTRGAVVSFGGIGRLSQCSTTFAMSVSIRGRDGGAMAEVSDLPNLRAASGGGSRAYVLFDPSRTLQPDGTVVETWMEHDVANALLKPSGTKAPLLAAVPKLAATLKGQRGKGGGGIGPEETLLPTYSQADSRARISASPASAEGSPGNAPACSSSSPGSQMSFDPDGSSSRTSWDCSPHRTAGISAPFFTRWPTSGTASHGGFSTLVSSEFPSGAVECSLSDVLETMVDERYALSPRAARGILRRAAARGRALPDALLAALTELAAA